MITRLPFSTSGIREYNGHAVFGSDGLNAAEAIERSVRRRLKRDGLDLWRLTDWVREDDGDVLFQGHVPAGEYAVVPIVQVTA